MTREPGLVGIFDSGVGGLSVAREIRRLLPAEGLLYVADSAYCPYGGRPGEEILARSTSIGNFLVSRGAKAIVVACNAASGASLEQLRAAIPVPVVGIEPALKPAALLSRNGRVGVMATAATLRAERFDRLMQSYGRDIEVVAQACPGLVDLVEQGINSGEEAHSLLEKLLTPLRTAEVDVVVLGCTHYPFLRDAIADILGPDVAILDTGEAVARQTERVLREAGLLAEAGSGCITVLTTGEPSVVGPVITYLWGEPIPVEHVDI